MFIRKHVNRAKKLVRIELRSWQLNQLRDSIKVGLGANWDKKSHCQRNIVLLEKVMKRKELSLMY